MCEIAIMIEDVVHEDPVHDTKMFKRGDVISVLPDGADWGDLALTNPRFRMIRLTGISVNTASTLLASEMADDPDENHSMLRSRMFNLDLEHSKLSRQFKAFLEDNTRKVPMFVVPATQANTLMTTKKMKKLLPNPNKLGDSNSQIGDR